jgi:hypothetical protein
VSDRIRVQPGPGKAFNVCRFAVWPGLLAIGWLSRPRPVGTVILIGVGVLFVIFELIAFVLFRKRLWVTDTGTGFVLEDRHGSRTLSDDDVEAISHSQKTTLDNGVRTGSERAFLFWTADRPEPIEFRNQFSISEPDPLEPLLIRLVENLTQRAEAELSRGKIVSGDGWQLDSTAIETGNGTRIPVSGISSVDVYDECVCVWTKGEEKAALQVPVRRRNAQLLLRLLAPRIDSTEAATPEDSESLGRVLFERRPKRSEIVVAIVLAMLCLVGGVALIWLAPAAFKLIGAVLIVVAGVALFHANSLKSLVFSCLQRGVRLTRRSGETSIRYDDVDSFLFSATRRYRRGMYQRTELQMSFESERNGRQDSIKFRTSLAGLDEELDRIRDHIAAVMAWHMANLLLMDVVVPWTEKLAFSQRGIELRETKSGASATSTLLAWKELGAATLEHGTLTIHHRNSDRVAVQAKSSEPNFFPGLELITNPTKYGISDQPRKRPEL